MLTSQTQEKADALNFKMLRAFMGYIENGSAQTIKLFQDDATREYFLKIGLDCFTGASLQDCINKAVDAGKHITY